MTKKIMIDSHPPFMGFVAPYLDLPLPQPGILKDSMTSQIQWDFIPGESLMLLPCIMLLQTTIFAQNATD